MKKILFALVACGCLTVPAIADLYSGSLTAGAGLTGTGPWADSAAVTWTVTQNLDGTWHYKYEISAEAKNFSHFIFEISNDFPNVGDLLNLDTGGLTGPVLGTYSSSDGSSNPGMPAPMYGIKFDTVAELTRSPMWGNIYAKDGKDGGKDGVEVYFYNTDFLSVGTILDRHALESPGAFIAVPNHFVPVPGAVLLGFLGLGYAGMKLRRKCA